MSYADRLGNRAVFKRFGYLAERLLVDEELLASCEDKLSEGFSALDPTQAKEGPRSQRWRLIVNVQLGDVASS